MNKDILDKQKILEKYYFEMKVTSIITLLFFLLCFIVFYLVSFMTDISNTINLINIIICCSPFLSMFLLAIFFINKAVDLINSNNYKLCTDIVVKKTHIYGAKYLNYSLKFKNINSDFPVNKQQYNEIQEGDLFYIFSLNLCFSTHYKIFPCSKYSLSSELQNKLNCK